MASESRKQAARRPRPPLPRPASGSTSKSACRSCPRSEAKSLSHEIFDPEVGDRAGHRSADQELHRKVIDFLGVLVVVRPLRQNPALREHVTDRPGHRLEPVARTCLFRARRHGRKRGAGRSNPHHRIAADHIRSASTAFAVLVIPELRKFGWATSDRVDHVANVAIIVPEVDRRLEERMLVTLDRERRRAQVEQPPVGQAAAPAIGPRARGKNGRGRRAVAASESLAVARSADRTAAPTCSTDSPPGQPSRKSDQSGFLRRISTVFSPSYSP